MTWFGRLLHRSRMEDQLDRELSHHLEALVYSARVLDAFHAKTDQTPAL
jgi:hypothetical protein